MKDQIKKALTDKGYSDAQAEAEIAILRDKVCRAEPTAAMLAGTTADDMIAVGVAPAAARAIGAMLAGPKPEKSKRYKPGRAYTAIEYAEHYERDPENVDLVADITRATDGKRWVVAPAGKFNAAESARYIQWHMDEDVAPATVLVNGAPIAPVMPGEERKKAAKLYHVDPFTAGAFLDVTMTSERTKASFVGYTDEALSAMAFLYERELRGEGALALRRFVDEMRGKEPADILGTGDTRAAWDANPKARPPAKREKVTQEKAGPFAEPIAQIPAAGAVGPVPSWLTARPPLAWTDANVRAFRDRLAAAIPEERRIASVIASAGLVSVATSGDPDLAWKAAFERALNMGRGAHLWAAIAEVVPALCAPEPSRSAAPLSADALRAAHGAIVAAGAAGSRSAFMAGIHPGVTSSIPTASDPGTQVWNDLHALVSVNLDDGSRPERVYLENAARLMGPRREAGTLRSLLAVVNQGVEPLRTGATPTILILGAHYERRAADQIRAQLSQEIRDGALRVVLDTDIRAGEDVARWNAARLSEATIIAGLISADTIVANVIPNDPRVIPIIARSIARLPAYLRGRQCIPADGKATDDWAAVAGSLFVAAGL